MDQLEKTITSLEVAEMVGKQHKEVLRDIRRIAEQLAERKNALSELFIESTYEDSTGRELPCYLLTKKGCELFSTRMTGTKGTQFALAYIERFNAMEKHINDKQIKLPDSPREILKLMFEYQEGTAERVDVIEDDLNDLKNNQLLTEPDYRTISSMVRNKVRILCSQQHLNNKAKAELFKDLNGGIKRITGVVARNRIKAKQFDEVIEFINNWIPSTATMTIIKQMELIKDE
ncbi:Rha family transcriptional regulator [Enterococcus dongliensis]|uniref:Rha family transcriptional regulator n=1 Tax=Enterococcus dongliensis TaxID=2559925 RepID=UPI00289103AE|nr:Rha family transcriptional regulator [Enterococcus dongliensis]MDT2677282.1 Rha family transcriptional regulator [Enterococcus dongliensis]